MPASPFFRAKAFQNVKNIWVKLCTPSPVSRKAVAHYPVLSNDVVSPLFEAVIEASEEAILNSLTMATTTHGYNAAIGKPSTIHAISLDALKRL